MCAPEGRARAREGEDRWPFNRNHHTGGGGERIGTAIVSTVSNARSILSYRDIVIYLFIFIFIPSRPSFKQRLSFAHP